MTYVPPPRETSLQSVGCMEYHKFYARIGYIDHLTLTFFVSWIHIVATHKWDLTSQKPQCPLKHRLGIILPD